MKIPLVDLKKQYISMKEEIDLSIQKVIDNSSFINGEDLKNFEKNFAQYCGRKYCIGVSNGTSALFVLLKCLGIGEGDEVITVPNTFIATVEAIKFCGAIPVFVDVDERTGLIDVEKIEDKINDKTKVLLPVHLYGNICDMNKIKKISEKFNLIVIEDCAQAHGSEYDGIKVPALGMGCFSFFPAKTLGCYGDAGGIVVDDEKLYEKIKMYVNHGRKDKYEHIEEGFNFRMDNLQAAILNVKLKYLDIEIDKRRELAKRYREMLSKIEKIEFFEDRERVKNSYYMFEIIVKENLRDALMKFLKGCGISCGIHYPISLNKQPVYKNKNFDAFPSAEKLSDEILSIPLYPYMTEGEQDYVVEKIREFFTGVED